jgi:GntR family transcriptional regulator/MocR family aminotransferase
LLLRSDLVAIEWTGLGPELLLRLDRDQHEPLGAQLQRQLRAAIRSGRLEVGERLPSSRTLARELGLSRGLVLESYMQLQAEGYLSTRVGSATRVAGGASARPPTLARPVSPPRLTVDFRPGVPDLTSFPMRDWLWALGEAGRQTASDAMGYGDPRGSAELRAVLASYLNRVRASTAFADHMVICSGFAQGINLVLSALADIGVRKVAVEDPGDRDNDTAAERAGLQAVPVPVDDHGVDVDALSAADVTAVILTPAHQTPTGVVLGPERRQALVAWADERAATIVEDDYDAEFRYDRQPVGSLQGLAPHRVVAMGSVSKSLAPAQRLGWIVAPPQLTELIARQKRMADRGSAGLDQLALAKLIESGRYDRHLRRMRSIYAARRRVLVDALATHAPQLRLGGLDAGFHAVAYLPDTAEEDVIISMARSHAIGLYGMSVYRSNGATRPPQLVLGFGNTNEGSIKRGIAAIGELLVGHHADSLE